jgi:dihydrolipoamide dehydrogenase
MSDHSTEVVIIGAGPGGYAAAFLASDLGLKVTLIDKEKNPGGVCLYKGCIPSKALLNASRIINEAKDAKKFGLEFTEPSINLDKLRNWKNEVVNKLTGGLGQLSRQLKINYIQGEVKFINSNTLSITGSDEKLTFSKVIIAAGSSPAKIPGYPESDRILDSTSALNIDNIPETLLIIGGGYIGLELGTVYSSLGTKVSVAEMTSGLLPGADRDLISILEKKIKASFDKVYLNTKAAGLTETGNGIKVKLEGKDVKEREHIFEKVLVSIGRKPNTNNLGLENTNVKINDKGFIVVNKKMQTDDESIYAIGDIVGEPMLAHKASHEGRVAAEVIAGKKSSFEPLAIPAVVFTDPEIAWCGLTETDAKKQGYDFTAAKFPWAASGRALTLGDSEGITKLIIDNKTQRIIGVGIAGHNAGELISEGVLAIEMGSTAKDLALSIHPHPTLSETVMEAAEIFYGQSTHIFRPKSKK